MRVEASAPGKIVVSGEYAVLLGAPALVLALERRIRVRLRPGERYWHVTGLGFESESHHPLDVLLSARGLPNQDPGFLLQHVLRAIATAGHPLTSLPAGLSIEIDSSAGFRDGRKLGIGTSAAVCVALTAALLACLGVAAAPLPIALLAHWQSQNGRGSGLDVASSALGGLIRFEARSGVPDVQRVDWPRGVGALAVWTGASADTRDYIARFDAWRAGTVPPPLGALIDAARTTVAALPDSNAFVRELRTFAARLRDFDVAAALGIHSPAHRRLESLAGDAVVYKPSGAGGGDLGIACAFDTSALATFAARATAEGFLAMPLEVQQDGVQVSIDR